MCIDSWILIANDKAKWSGEKQKNQWKMLERTTQSYKEYMKL